MFGVSYWIVPIFSALVWLAMLLAMLVTWLVEGSPHYPSMNPSQRIAYISDVGAQGLKPLFIAMSAVTVVTLDLVFVIERWLRHKGRLTPNTSWFQKSCSLLSIVAAVVGAAGLILLSIFDTLRHPRLHNVFLALFIVGYIVSAIFICAEYQRLGIHFREHRILRISFWVKLVFILVELALAIAFGVSQTQDHYNVAAVLEWIIALIFTLYVISFSLDFIPAVKTKHHDSEETTIGMAEQSATEDPSLHASRGRFHNRGPAAPVAIGETNGFSHSHNSSYANGYASNGLNGTKSASNAQPATNY